MGRTRDKNQLESSVLEWEHDGKVIKGCNPWEWFSPDDLEEYTDPFTMLQADRTSSVRKPKRQKFEEKEEPLLLPQYKYWQQRHAIFSLYDEGIQIDPTGWYSVTPELLAMHQVRQTRALLRRSRVKLGDSVVIDPFVGVGGNAIQFAKQAGLVIGSDTSKERLSMAKVNATIYETDLELIQADFTTDFLRIELNSEFMFASPPWGGPVYAKQPYFEIETLDDQLGVDFMQRCREFADCFALFLPRNTNIYDLVRRIDDYCLVECNWIESGFKGVTVYVGFEPRDVDWKVEQPEPRFH